MASVQFVCQFCGMAGRHLTKDGMAPLDEPGICDEDECRAKHKSIQDEANLVAAKAEMEATKAQYEALRDAASGADAAPHDLTVAELKMMAADHGIDLGDSTRKADIRDKVIAGLNVAALRDFAHREGIDLHGAQSRDGIVAALNTSPVQPDDSYYAPAVTPVNFGSYSRGSE